MHGLLYVFALFGFLMAAKWLSAWKYERDCWRDYERKTAEREAEKAMSGNVLHLTDNNNGTDQQVSPGLEWNRRAIK
jgi:hypothetical protein